MTSSADPLPEFEEPPVTEVVLGVQFQPIPGIRPSLLARWDHARVPFPDVEEKPPIKTLQEAFGLRIPSVRFSNASDPPAVRTWLKSADNLNLLQIQPDAIYGNWRAAGRDRPYPRYPTLLASFTQNLDAFAQFLADRNLGTLSPVQCEVTYVNEIETDVADAVSLIAGLSVETSDGFLSTPESLDLTARHVITGAEGQPIGRLHIDAKTLRLISPARQVLRLTLVARGAPADKTIRSALSWINTGREWVVRGFASFTSKKAHRRWKRRT